MPLNVENKQYVTLEEEAPPKPFIHQPKKEYHTLRYFSLGLFIIIVVSSSVFLIYLFYFNLNAPIGTIAQVTPSPESKQTEPTQIPGQKISQPPTEQPTSPTPVEQNISGQPISSSNLIYTVYIGVYDIKKPAQEEVARWNQAGFVASVIHLKNNYRVSLGKYKTVNEAETFAYEWSDAFEYGYWIGTIE
jgi:cytoskeletal protein RodZ